MENTNWEFFYYLAYSMVGQKVLVDDKHTGILRMVLGGPLELFLVIFTKDDILYVDAYDQSMRIKFPNEI